MPFSSERENIILQWKLKLNSASASSRNLVFKRLSQKVNLTLLRHTKYNDKMQGLLSALVLQTTICSSVCKQRQF
jgi:hypothetical protein